MDENTLHKEKARADHAKRILEDELVKEALTLIRTNLHAIWETSKSAEQEQREESWRMLKILNEFERYFLQVMESGKIAEKELSMLEKTKKRAKSLF